jgi:hypothetical protein
MIKHYLSAFFWIISLAFAAAQSVSASADTLLLQNFDSQVDPSLSMLSVPTGFDGAWINYDADHAEGQCVSSPDGPPMGWFWDTDFSTKKTSANYAFTSCSWLNPAKRTRNWLIAPPVFIPDSNLILTWRSLSLQGPLYHDGYQVLISTTSNIPEDLSFTDTLFTQAEMLQELKPGSLNPNDYVFSAGYIQANGYTDTNYYFLDTFFTDNGQQFPFLHGKLEPHQVSLKKYADQWVYIAILHDSRDDYMLQVDDIIVRRRPTVSSPWPSSITTFDVFPNPATDNAFVSWTLQTPHAVRFMLMDARGSVLMDRHFDKDITAWRLPLPSLPAGIYRCVLHSTQGSAVRNLLIRQ